MKMFGTVFFALSMFFLGYILLAGSPMERINRGCLPMTWVGRAMTTLASFGSESAESRVRDSADGMFQGCRVFVFRQFYAEELKAMKEQQAAAEAAAKAAVPAGGAR